MPSGGNEPDRLCWAGVCVVCAFGSHREGATCICPVGFTSSGTLFFQAGPAPERCHIWNSKRWHVAVC